MRLQKAPYLIADVVALLFIAHGNTSFGSLAPIIPYRSCKHYLDAELISLLMEIHRCPYFALITKFQHSGVLDKLTNIGPSEELVPVQQLYKRLKKYVGE